MTIVPFLACLDSKTGRSWKEEEAVLGLGAFLQSWSTRRKDTYSDKVGAGNEAKCQLARYLLM